jgi:hypothetical protein
VKGRGGRCWEGEGWEEGSREKCVEKGSEDRFCVDKGGRFGQ